ncbi:histone-fold-containing protein [Aureobasidium subglaciale]|nr:histone-fold-containing protein [Aureobasidium subglaciale]
MPGRKSNLATVTNGEDESPAPTGRAAREGSSVEVRIKTSSDEMRWNTDNEAGPSPTTNHDFADALLALSKSCTVFVNFLAANSNEYAQIAGKKTIQPADVMAALKENEFEHFIPRLEAELKKYNTVQCDKRNSYRRKIREEKASKTGDEKHADSGAENGDADASMLDATEMSAVNGHSRSDDQPPSKKMRREAGEEDVSEGDEEEFHDALEGEGEDDEGVEGDGDDEVEEEGDEDEEGDEEQVEDGGDEEDERIGDGMRDEALDSAEDSD